MTVIAWDGKTLAADRLAVNGQTRTTVCKIAAADGELMAITGDLSVGQEMLHWYINGAKPAEFPTSNRDPEKGCSLVVIKRGGLVAKFESGPHPFYLAGDYQAFGCGDQAALAAMACGKTAREAVEIACQINTGCGNGTDTLTLDAP